MANINFKNSELGPIPNEWEVELIGNLFEFKNGLNKSKQFFGYGSPIINYTDVYHHRGLKKDNVRGLVFLNKNEIFRYLVKVGDVFFTRTSETPDEVGLTSVLIEEIENCSFSGFVLRARPITDRIDKYYCQYCFSTKQIRKTIINSCTYTTRALTNGGVLSKILLPLPPLPEQRRIAAALSDIDALIDNLDALIDKKRLIKQATMQQLLSGKKRINGFNDKWVEKKLGEICGKITTGKLDANAMNPNGLYRFYTCAEKYYMIDTYAFDTEALLISGNGENVGYVHYYNGKFNAYQRTYVLTDFSEEIMYIKYFLSIFLKYRINVEKSDSNTPYIKMDTLFDMVITLPPTLAEQTAISKILSDMDDEISLLEAKKEKYTAIKQGMMQQLLSGRVRLK